MEGFYPLFRKNNCEHLVNNVNVNPFFTYCQLKNLESEIIVRTDEGSDNLTVIFKNE
jgi:hypothetical protein